MEHWKKEAANVTLETGKDMVLTRIYVTINEEGGVNMPGKDKTGPVRARGVGGRRQGGGTGAGAGGNCYCPKCSYRSAHVPGQPCSSLNCPKCGTPMIRES
jgi:hypothetical protein